MLLYRLKRAVTKRAFDVEASCICMEFLLHTLSFVFVLTLALWWIDARRWQEELHGPVRASTI